MDQAVFLVLDAPSRPQVAIPEDGIMLAMDFNIAFIAENSFESEAVNPVTLVVFTCSLTIVPDVKINSTSVPDDGCNIMKEDWHQRGDKSQKKF